MSELPDFKKIEFPDMPPIPLEEVVPDASPEVSSITLIYYYTFVHCMNLFHTIPGFIWNILGGGGGGGLA